MANMQQLNVVSIPQVDRSLERYWVVCLDSCLQLPDICRCSILHMNKPLYHIPQLLNGHSIYQKFTKSSISGQLCDIVHYPARLIIVGVYGFHEWVQMFTEQCNLVASFNVFRQTSILMAPQIKGYPHNLRNEISHISDTHYHTLSWTLIICYLAMSSYASVHIDSVDVRA